MNKKICPQQFLSKLFFSAQKQHFLKQQISISVPDITYFHLDNEEEDETALIKEDELHSKKEEIIEKEGKNEDENEDKVDGKVKEKVIKRQLQKSLSYGHSSPADEIKETRTKVKHSISVNPSALKAARTAKCEFVHSELLIVK